MSKLEEVLSAWRTATIEKLAGNMRPDAKGPIVLCVCKNERWRLDGFLEHYKSLGAERFAFIDNGSGDDTRAFLASQPGVDLYSCAERFSSQAQRGWLHQVMAGYGLPQWFLCVDADELIVYSGSESHSLAELTDRADRAGLERIRGVFVDMYGPGPVSEYEKLETWPEVAAYCRYFDGTGYVSKVSSRRVETQGGPRARMFRDIGEGEMLPEMTKYPLFKAGRGDLMIGAHHLLPVWKNFASACVLGILHYKFSRNDFLKIREALELGQHWNGSFEYKCYAEWLRRFPERSLVFDGAKEYFSPDDLVSSGLIEAIDWTARDAKIRLRYADVAAWRDPLTRKRLLRTVRGRLRAAFNRPDYADFIEKK